MYAGVALFDNAATPSPTRNTTKDVELPPPPLELELDELDELELEGPDPDDELAPELDDELELLAFPPPMPLLDAELLDDWAPHWPASPPSPPFPLPIPGGFVPWAQATMMNGVSASAERAKLVRERERRRSTMEPF
jgi:hypothetical protein